MFSGMGDERAGDSKGLSTAVTYVGLLPGVAAHMVSEGAGLGKALPAAVTHVGLLPAVLPANQHRHQ